MSSQRDEGANPFVDVDRSPWAAEVLTYLDRVAGLPGIKRWHAEASALIRVRPGERVLEAGCGTGAVARELAALVGPDGEVIGLDLSAELVAEAKRRTPDTANVRYEVGDVTALPFPDDSFDVVRCERVLQHIADPDVAVRELVRVARPGGRVCVLDMDWGSLLMDLPDRDLVERLVAHVMAHSPSPDVGRTLRRRFSAAGLVDDVVHAVPFVFTDLAEAAVAFPWLDPAIPADVDMVPAADRDAWFDALAKADAAGEFCTAALAFVIVGLRPV